MAKKKKDQPFMPFYIGDWFKAPEIRALPHANRMVWFEILCLMWQSEEKGYLTINRQPFVITDDITGVITKGAETLGNMLGISENFLQESFVLFKKYGVFKVRKDKAIYSGFMVKLLSIKDSKSKAGKKGMANRYSASVITEGVTDLLTRSEYENEYIYTVLRLIENKEKREINKNEYMLLIVEMAKTFMNKNPEYFFEKETDYHACLQIAYNIAQMKKWMKAEVTNGKMKDTLKSWDKIVDFIKEDKWLKTRSLSDISSTKEWQRLVQSMNNAKNTTEKKFVN